MVNAIVWPIVVFLAPIFLAPTDQSEVPPFAAFIFVALMAFLSLPFAWMFLWPPLDYRPSEWDLIQLAVIIGVNSTLWGYGLSAIISWCLRKPTTISQ
jgi:hypothetical protein